MHVEERTLAGAGTNKLAEGFASLLPIHFLLFWTAADAATSFNLSIFVLHLGRHFLLMSWGCVHRICCQIVSCSCLSVCTEMI